MPRQYTILYKRAASKFSQLEPGVHASLYGDQDVQDAIEHMRTHPVIEGMAIHKDNEMFNIVSYSQEAIGPKAFIFAGEPGGPELAGLPVPSPAEGDSAAKTLA